MVLFSKKICNFVANKLCKYNANNITKEPSRCYHDDPIKSPVVQEIIMSNRIGAISVELAKRLNIEPVKALQMFYESKTCEDLHERSTGLYLYGDLYVADEFMREKNLL